MKFLSPILYNLSDYTYELPSELIAQEAIHPHHDARLMVIDREDGTIIDESTFWDLDRYIPKDRVIFFNNSRVLPARIRLKNITIEKVNGEKNTIQDGEILFLAKQSHETFEALVRPGKRFSVGTKIHFPLGTLEVISMTNEGRILKARGTNIEEIMRIYGELPLPPYIEYGKEKEADYQTTFAEKDGSVAAPTASLHFTRELLEKIDNEKEYLTLHVGLGTFRSIHTNDVRDYHIHSELVEVSLHLFATIAELKEAGKKVLAVGTTACRTLESLPYLWQGFENKEKAYFREPTRAYWDQLTQNLEQKNFIHSRAFNPGISTINFSTAIYLYPGCKFLVVDDLITNFHLSESSLLVLVSAFLEQKKTMKLYEYAIKEKYRFFSFGDGMYIRT